MKKLEIIRVKISYFDQTGASASTLKEMKVHVPLHSLMAIEVEPNNSVVYLTVDCRNAIQTIRSISIQDCRLIDTQNLIDEI